LICSLFRIQTKDFNLSLSFSALLQIAYYLLCS